MQVPPNCSPHRWPSAGPLPGASGFQGDAAQAPCVSCPVLSCRTLTSKQRRPTSTHVCRFQQDGHQQRAQQTLGTQQTPAAAVSSQVCLHMGCQVGLQQ